MTSFGFSPSDILGVAQLAWTVYAKCKGAAAGYQELGAEVLGAHQVLLQLQNDLSAPGSAIRRNGPSAERGLVIFVRGCEGSLHQVLDVLEKYPSLAEESNKKRLRDKLAFGHQDIASLQSRLHFHVQMLGVFFSEQTTVTVTRVEDKVDATRASLEAKVDRLCAEVENLNRKSKSLEGDIWKDIRTDLEKRVEITDLEEDDNRTVVGNTVKELIGKRSSADANTNTDTKKYKRAGWGSWNADTEKIYIEDLYGDANKGERRIFTTPPILEDPKPIPLGWQRVETPMGRIYYTHLELRLLTYQHPLKWFNTEHGGKRALRPAQSRQHSGMHWVCEDALSIPCQLSRRYFREVNGKLYYRQSHFGTWPKDIKISTDPPPGYARLAFGSVRLANEMRETMRHTEKLKAEIDALLAKRGKSKPSTRPRRSSSTEAIAGSQS